MTDLAAPTAAVETSIKSYRKGPYAFPLMCQRPLEAVATTELIMRLEELAHHPLYAEIRTEYCCINIELNTRWQTNPEGITAPRFRPQQKRPRIRKGHSYNKADRELSNDTQVIDLHWAHIRGYNGPKRSRDSLAQEMWGKKTRVFDFGKASEFVASVGSAKAKIESGRFDVDAQWEMSSIQSEEIRERWKEYRHLHSQVLDDLTVRGRRNHHIRGNEEDWAYALVADFIERSITGSPSSATRAAHWYSLMTGRKISRQAMRSKLDSIARHTGLL